MTMGRMMSSSRVGAGRASAVSAVLTRLGAVSVACWCFLTWGNHGYGGCEAFVAQRHPTTLFRGVSSPVQQQQQVQLLSLHARRTTVHDEDEMEEMATMENGVEMQKMTRRGMLNSAAAMAATAAATTLAIMPPQESLAAMGSLPELSDPNTNAILQGVTVSVADLSQQEAMIQFLTQGFSFQILRQQTTDSITDTWLGFGPEQLSTPSDFVVPVSSFAKNGGHASIHIRYDAKTMDAPYRKGDPVPGTSIAYLQVAVPAYRISQMVANGGNVLDAFGFVNVVSPCGLPMRGIVGIWPDPIMFVAINCDNVGTSRDYYQALGFREQEYPYSRPNKGAGQFEPMQPLRSVYMAQSSNCMGVLLVPAEKRNKVKRNPIFQSMNIVYTPSSSSESESSPPPLVDPSGNTISFMSTNTFEELEFKTRTGTGAPKLAQNQ
eukprot:scaffold3695_cov54-Attheya_sp.AAC.2